jgi:hypothetical protein
VDGAGVKPQDPQRVLTLAGPAVTSHWTKVAPAAWMHEAKVQCGNLRSPCYLVLTL